MGTRGLRIIRYRGRYYIYYNHWDSYPEGLGKILVNAIPVNPKKYKKWLQDQRQKLEPVSIKLEDTVLTVPFDTDENSAAIASGEEAVIEKEKNKMFAYDIKEAIDDETDESDDDREDNDKGNLNNSNGSDALGNHKGIVKHFVYSHGLEDMPSPVCMMGLDLFIEWTYTIDLDRELFSINTNTHFKMNDIPRDTWMDGFTDDYEEEEGGKGWKPLVGTCPQAMRKLPPPAYFNSYEEVQSYAAKYASYKSSTVSVKRAQPRASPSPMEMLALVTLHKFIFAFEAQFVTYISGWSHEDFAFREFAFAILCFAAGEYHFEAPRRLVGNADAGYLHYSKSEDVTTPEGSKFLPVFPIGSHHPGQTPGSAPSTGMFWFRSVLVSLVPDYILQDESLSKAAVAEVVDFGLADGKRSFNALIFSALNAVMIKASVEDVRGGDATKTKSVIVKHTLTTSIVPAAALERKEPEQTHQFNYPESFEGFLSLMTFFEASISQELSRYDQGRLPVEMFAKILAEVPDFYAYSKCAMVSKTFFELSQKNSLFNQGIAITKYTAPKSDTLTFKMKDRQSGQVFTTTHLRCKGIEVWYPIIGVDKPSIIRQVHFGLKPTKR